MIYTKSEFQHSSKRALINRLITGQDRVRNGKITDDRLAELGAIERFICERGVTECPPAFLWVSPQGERVLEPIAPLVAGYMAKQRREP